MFTKCSGELSKGIIVRLLGAVLTSNSYLLHVFFFIKGKSVFSFEKNCSITSDCKTLRCEKNKVFPSSINVRRSFSKYDFLGRVPSFVCYRNGKWMSLVLNEWKININRNKKIYLRYI